MNKKKYSLIAIIFTLTALITFPVFANPGIACSANPSKIPPNGVTTITVTYIQQPGDPASTSFTTIDVRDPGPDGIQGNADDTVHTWVGAIPGTITNGQSWTFQYGTGVADWSPAATSQYDGYYYIHAQGTNVNNSGHFDASADFSLSVPEFAAAAMIISSIGFITFSIFRRGRRY